MGETRDRFPAAYNWRRLMNRMTDAQCGQFWRAIYDYQIDGIEYAGDDPVVGMAFDSTVPFMEACKKQYEIMCDRNRENGKKGGRPKKNPETQNPVGFSDCETENPDGFLGYSEKPSETQKSRFDLIRLDSIREDKIRPVLSNDNNRESARAGEVVVGVDGKEMIFRRYREAISPSMSRDMEQELTEAAEAWPAEVVLSAIDAALDAGKATGSYVCGVLRNYRRQGIKTMDDVRRNRIAHQTSRADLPRDDIAHMFGDGVPQFIDTVGLMIEQGITGEKMQDAVLGGFPPS